MKKPTSIKDIEDNFDEFCYQESDTHKTTKEFIRQQITEILEQIELTQYNKFSNEEEIGYRYANEEVKQIINNIKK